LGRRQFFFVMDGQKRDYLSRAKKRGKGATKYVPKNDRCSLHDTLTLSKCQNRNLHFNSHFPSEYKLANPLQFSSTLFANVQG